MTGFCSVYLNANLNGFPDSWAITSRAAKLSTVWAPNYQLTIRRAIKIDPSICAIGTTQTELGDGDDVMVESLGEEHKQVEDLRFSDDEDLLIGGNYWLENGAGTCVWEVARDLGSFCACAP